MVTVKCPCCGASYTADGAFEDGQRLLCERCGKKHFCFQGELIPISPEIPRPKETVRQTECPYCATAFEWQNDDEGEYSCPECGKIFHLGPRLQYAEREDAPREDTEPEDAPREDAVSAGRDAASAPLLRFAGETAAEAEPILAPNPRLKVGLPRERSGIGGIFIGIAEKLCGN